MKIYTLVLLLLITSCSRSPEYISNYGSFTVELKGLPRFDCKGFEQYVINHYKNCLNRADKDERGVHFYGEEERCIRWAKEAWCSVE